MGTIRPEQPNRAQEASDKAEANKTAAAAAVSVPALRIVVADNGDAIQLNAQAIQRLEAIVDDLQRRLRRV